MSEAVSIGLEAVVIPYTLFVPLIKDVADVLIKVVDLCQTAQHNKRIAELLKKRIEAANTVIDLLKENKLNNPIHYANLQRLLIVLRKMETFCGDITQYNKLKDFLEAKSIESKYKDLCEDYDSSVSALSLSVSVSNLAIMTEFKANSERDLKILKEEIQEALKFQNALFESMSDMNEKLEKGEGKGIYTISSAVKDMVDILNKITDLYCVAEHSKKITKILIERIAIAFVSLSILPDDGLYDSRHRDILKRFVQVLQDMKKFSEDITQYNKSQKLEIKSIDSTFNKLCKDYDTCANLLNLTITVDLNINAERDKKFLKEDIKEFQQLQANLGTDANVKANKIRETGDKLQSDPFARFIPFINEIAGILSKAVDLLHTAESNKKITKILIEHIATVFSALSIIREDNIYTLTYDVDLHRLVQVLQKMKSFIEAITQCNASQKFLGTKIKTIQKGFKDLCKEYDDDVKLLNFDDLKKKDEYEEDKAMKEDIKELLEFRSAKNTITKILDEVKELCKSAQHNKNISKVLTERIAVVNSAVQKCDVLFISHSYTSLHRLVQVLQNMEKYIEEITQYNAKQKVLGAKTIEKKIKDLREEYDDNVNLLNFNLMIDFKSNAQEEDKILLKFQAALAECMIVEVFDEVTRLCKTAQRDKNKIKILTERISEIYSAISILQEREDLLTPDYCTGLQRLVKILQDMKECAEEIIQDNPMQKFLKVKAIERNFFKLCREYANNNLVDSSKFNLQEEDRAIEEDIKEFLKFQAASMKDTIAKILTEVTDLHNNTTQNNKTIIKLLMKRVAEADSAVSIISQDDNLFTPHYYSSHTNLHRLVQVLQDMRKFEFVSEIAEIEQYDANQRFLEANKIVGKFKDLCKEYDSVISISLLNFNLTSDFKFNTQEDKSLLKFLAALAKDTIVEIHNEVKELYKTAQHNKKITEILMTRISEAHSTVILDYGYDYTDLQKLVQVLQDMKKYIETITQYNAARKVLEDNTIEKKFKNLREEYDNNINLLNCIDFKKFNPRKEDKVLNEDIKELSEFQAALAESMTDTNMDKISADTAAIYFGLFVPLIKDVANILNEVIDLYRNAEHNKRITKVLMDRISEANSAVSIHILRKEDSYTSKDITNLKRLVKVLQNVKEFIEGITQYNALQRWLEDNTDNTIDAIKEKFKDLRKQYDTSIKLNLADFKKFDEQEEDKVLKEDIEKFSKFQAASADNMKQKVTKSNDENNNDKMNSVIEQVSELVITMQGLTESGNQGKIDKIFIFDKPLLPFKDYKEADDGEPRSEKLRKYVHVKTKEEFAFKTINVEDHINQIKNQVTIFKKFEYCQNIIHFYGLAYDEHHNNYYLVTEWAKDKSLREYILLYGKEIDINYKLKFACDIAKGLNFLNAVKMLHRDVRSENIVITGRDVAKITNFKLYRNVDQKVNKDYVRYCAPEILSTGEGVEQGESKIKYDKYNTKCEIYSFGILLWEIAECRTPYSQLEDITEITKNVISKNREPFTPYPDIPKKYQDLVNKSIDHDPDLRPTFAEMLIGLQNIIKPISPERELSTWVKNAVKEGTIDDIKWSDLAVISNIGSGNFGSVCKAHWQKKKLDVVFKRLLLNSEHIQGDEITNEIRMQTKAHNCDNVIRFLGITQEHSSNNYCIVMEYADGGDLRKYLANVSPLGRDNMYRLAFDITNGVHYLHSEGIIHRDLHAKNIVIKEGRAKITDFGYAKKVEANTKIHKGIFGIVPYMAPELLSYKRRKDQFPPFSKKSDIYSLGVLFWELSSGRQPFKDGVYDEKLLILQIINGTREQEEPDTPPDYFKLYTDCWRGDPNERPDIGEVYSRLEGKLPAKDNENVPKAEDKKDDSEFKATESTLVSDGWS